VNILASLIENTTHELVTDARATGDATALRTASAALAKVNALLVPVLAQNRQLHRQRTVAARQLQVQLARLKNVWRSNGMMEAEIHAIIPDRPLSTRSVLSKSKSKSKEAAAAAP